MDSNLIGDFPNQDINHKLSSRINVAVEKVTDILKKESGKAVDIVLQNIQNNASLTKMLIYALDIVSEDEKVVVVNQIFNSCDFVDILY